VSRTNAISVRPVAAVCVVLASVWGNVPAIAAGSGDQSVQSAKAARELISYELTRYAIDTKQEFASFIAKFEQAVPPFNLGAITAGVKNWDDVVANTAKAAPHSFLIYSRLPGSELFRIHGVGFDKRRGIGYLMGNHVIAETMYRNYPGAILNAPLRVHIFENESGNAVFQIERPSDHFGSFGDKDIAAVGSLLNGKLIDLFKVLDVPVPASLAGTLPSRP